MSKIVCRLLFYPIVFIFLMTTVCLWTLGYKEKEDWNGDRTRTLCKVTFNSVILETCEIKDGCRIHSEYGCVKYHTRDVNCYDVFARFEHPLNGRKYSKLLEIGDGIMSNKTINNILRQYYVGYKTICYFYNEDPRDITLNLKNSEHYKKAAIAVSIITALMVMIACYLEIIWNVSCSCDSFKRLFYSSKLSSSSLETSRWKDDETVTDEQEMA